MGKITPGASSSGRTGGVGTKSKGSAHSLNVNRRDGKEGQRTAGTVRRLQMYRNFKPKRNKQGRITVAAPFQSHVETGTRARVEPSRSWFANTKTISQGTLQKFQEDMKEVANNPFKVIMKKTVLPVTLLNESKKTSRVHLLDTEKYVSTFGKKSTRKRPRIQAGSVSELVNAVETANNSYDAGQDKDLSLTNAENAVDFGQLPRENIFGAGQSKRIWNELYKVIDSSDVVVQVLDSRDPLGTRSTQIEKYMKKDRAHKHLILVLNKIDLVPTWATKKWISILSEEYPTVAFHASLKNPWGKGTLINLLRQYGKLHKDSKQISVGFIG
jgi:nuclear GTP-binding protein